MTKGRILIVDDEVNARSALKSLLTDEGYEISEAGDGEEALERLADSSPDLVLSDVRMPRLDGLAFLKKARESGSQAAFVMMTAFGSIELAVQAMRDGAENFLVKPLDFNAVLIVIEKVLGSRRRDREAEALRERVRERYSFPNIVGDAPELQAVFEVVKRAAPTKATVLLLGESGTGKELVAQALHESSTRAEKPFIRVNCAALSETLLESELFGHERGSFTGAVARREGRFELAEGGTLFLDEVGEIAPSIQVKLLRVLQQREFERVGGTQTIKVDVRIVAATNRDLAAEVKAGRFREDLYYRLNVVAVTLPALRQRMGDIPALVNHFLEKYAKAYDKDVHSFAPGTMNALLAYSWPGNVRELENVVERAVVLCPGHEITAEDLPATLRAPRNAPALVPPINVIQDGGGIASLYDIEKHAILSTLDKVGGSTAKAAEVLGISVRKIQYRIKEYATGTKSHEELEPAHLA